MTILIVAISALVIFDLAALLWGADSREGFDDAEWERRQEWRGFY